MRKSRNVIIHNIIVVYTVRSGSCYLWRWQRLRRQEILSTVFSVKIILKKSKLAFGSNSEFFENNTENPVLSVSIDSCRCCTLHSLTVPDLNRPTYYFFLTNVHFPFFLHFRHAYIRIGSRDFAPLRGPGGEATAE